MAWVWGAKFECGHETGGTVENKGAYVTPLELDEDFWCPQCKGDKRIVLTWGRGR